jgi:hypothetical protein
MAQEWCRFGQHQVGLRQLLWLLSCSGSDASLWLPAGMPFSSVVLDAKAKGYTEPDPREDLSGGFGGGGGSTLCRFKRTAHMIQCKRHMPHLLDTSLFQD